MNWEAEARLLEIAMQQLGLFTIKQALAAGVTRKMLRTRIGQGAWTRYRRGVLLVAGHRHRPLSYTWRRSSRQAWTALGRRIALGRGSGR